MGYSFYLLSKDKDISESDFNTAIDRLSEFNKKSGIGGKTACDVTFNSRYICVSGSFGISGQYAEGFVLNLMINLIELGYVPRVISNDWDYGTKADFKWLNNIED